MHDFGYLSNLDWIDQMTFSYFQDFEELKKTCFYSINHWDLSSQFDFDFMNSDYCYLSCLYLNFVDCWYFLATVVVIVVMDGFLFFLLCSELLWIMFCFLVLFSLKIKKVTIFEIVNVKIYFEYYTWFITVRDILTMLDVVLL